MTTTHPPIELTGAATTGVVVELVSLPGAGAIWATPDMPTGCQVEDAGHVVDRSAVGGAVTHRFRITARRPGRYALRFELKRPSEAVAREVQPVTVDLR